MTATLEDALARLQATLAALETAVGRRLDGDVRRHELETELQLMQDDRARLAVELEGATARLSRLEGATTHVGHRVRQAIGSLREVLGPDEAASGAEPSPAALRREPARQEPARQEPVRQEPARQEPSWQEPARQEPA